MTKSIVKKSTTGSLPPAVPLAITPTFSPWTHTSDDSYLYQLSLVLATATVSIFEAERDGVLCRVRAAVLRFVLAAHARNLLLSASFGWAEEAQKSPRTKRRRRCSHHRGLELSSICSFDSPGCRGSWPIELVTKWEFQPPMSCFEVPPTGYAVL